MEVDADKVSHGDTWQYEAPKATVGKLKVIIGNKLICPNDRPALCARIQQKTYWSVQPAALSTAMRTLLPGAFKSTEPPSTSLSLNVPIATMRWEKLCQYVSTYRPFHLLRS